MWNLLKNLSRNDFTIIFWKNTVLVDYIGIFFTCGNTFGHMLYVPLIFKNLYFIYLNRCYSYIFCFHFKGWQKRRIIHIASSGVLQHAENVMSKSNPRKCKKKKSLRYILRVIVMLFLRAKVIPVNPQIHANVMRPLRVLIFIFLNHCLYMYPI